MSWSVPSARFHGDFTVRVVGSESTEEAVMPRNFFFFFSPVHRCRLSRPRDTSAVDAKVANTARTKNNTCTRSLKKKRGLIRSRCPPEGSRRSSLLLSLSLSLERCAAQSTHTAINLQNSSLVTRTTAKTSPLHGTFFSHAHAASRSGADEERLSLPWD